MGDLILGMLAAVAASTLYSLGIALQALDAKLAPQSDHLRLTLARTLVRRRRWLLGTALSLLGWPLQVLALLLAPLAVVQPTLAAGLLVLMLAGQRILGERAGGRERLAVLAIVFGVAGAAAAAPALHHTHGAKLGPGLGLALFLLGLASLAPYMLRALGRPHPSATILGAGLAFGFSGVTTKLASDALSGGQVGLALIWALATAGASALAALSEMSALQERPAIQVAPVVFVTQTVVPLVLAPLVLGERFTSGPLDGAPLALALALLIAGAAVLARSPLLLALMEGERTSAPSDSMPRRLRSSSSTIRSSPSTEAPLPSALTTSTSPARTEA
jgi:hypothetical protein